MAVPDLSIRASTSLVVLIVSHAWLLAFATLGSLVVGRISATVNSAPVTVPNLTRRATAGF